MIVNPPFGIPAGGGPPVGHIPLTSQFSWQLQAGNFGGGTASQTDTAGGLLFFMPKTGNAVGAPGVLKQNAAFPGGPSTTLATPFTFDVGFTTDLGTGAGNPLPTTCGIFIGETASRGPVGGGQNWRGIMFGLAQTAPLTSDVYLAYTEMGDIFTNGGNNLGLGDSTGSTTSGSVVSPKPVFFRIVSSGGTFSFYYGPSLGSLSFWMSIAYNHWLQNPVDALTPIGLMGLAAYNINGQPAGINTTYNYYNVT